AFGSDAALQEITLPDSVKWFGRRPFPRSTTCRACPEVARKFANAQKPDWWEEMEAKAKTATPEN
ncbi:MAG: hypothetical protein IJE77_02935, partial [Thermoguttaceae bacterium]|nr:hypothetical protein [Thermoguttaceae bacterium]